jgi:hypothetical protein
MISAMFRKAYQVKNLGTEVMNARSFVARGKLEHKQGETTICGILARYDCPFLGENLVISHEIKLDSSMD